MVTSNEIAAREMAEPFKGLAAVNDWPVHWPNLIFDKPTKSETVWAKWALMVNDSRQITLGSHTGKRRYRTTGMIVVDIFSPLAQGATGGIAYMSQVQRVYRQHRTPSGVAISNARVAAVGQSTAPDNAWLRTTIVADFEYDTIQ